MTSFVPAPVKQCIPFSVLESIDIRVGTIQNVRDVAGSRKLLNLTVAFGDLFDLGYADGLMPRLAVPESPLPDGARAG